MRHCNTCDKTKNLSEFSNSKTGKFGKHSTCKKCVCNTGKKWRDSNKQFLWAKNIKKYWPGASIETVVENYSTLLKRQENVCAICANPDKQKLSVDHCHITKRVRGLLCHKCNLALGKFKDRKELLFNAINYLK